MRQGKKKYQILKLKGVCRNIKVFRLSLSASIARINDSFVYFAFHLLFYLKNLYFCTKFTSGWWNW